MADNDRNGFGQKAANIMAGLLFTIGGYVWTESAKQIGEIQHVTSSQGQQIARLEERRDFQEALITDLRSQLRRMEDKLDAALKERGALSGRMFDK